MMSLIPKSHSHEKQAEKEISGSVYMKELMAWSNKFRPKNGFEYITDCGTWIAHCPNAGLAASVVPPFSYAFPHANVRPSTNI